MDPYIFFFGGLLLCFVAMVALVLIERTAHTIYCRYYARRFATSLAELKAPQWGIAYREGYNRGELYIGPVSLRARTVMFDRGLQVEEYRGVLHYLRDNRKNRIGVDDIDAFVPMLVEMKWLPPKVLWHAMCSVLKKADYEIVKTADSDGDFWEAIPAKP